ncbi:MAG: hypothetical protein JO066_06000 [Verrucomicrobia bacterium]|nr:hypothetical protein [Verrucomicrobiota bacterium]MBV9298511.1 hypothetical protein [Verrucomicrobiota bacterium]
MSRAWPSIQPAAILQISPITFTTVPWLSAARHGLRKISSETGSLTLAPDGIPVTSTRLFNAKGLITMSGLDVVLHEDRAHRKPLVIDIVAVYG